MSVPRISHQDNVFQVPNQTKYNMTTIQGAPEVHSAGVTYFPAFKGEKQKLTFDKKTLQEPIKMPHISSMSSLQIFNINSLLSKQLYDAAEYFLGRPLTPAERMIGSISKQEQKETTQRSDSLGKKETDASILGKLAALVTAEDVKKTGKEVTDKAILENLVSLVAAAEAKKEEEEEDDEEIPLSESDLAALQDLEDNPDDVWTNENRQRYIDLFGEEEFDMQSQTDASEWDKEMLTRYRAVMAPIPEVSSMGPQGKKYVDDAFEITYKPDTQYTGNQLKEFVSQMRREHPELKSADKANQSPLYKTPFPTSKKEMEIYVANAHRAVLDHQLNQAILKEDAEDAQLYSEQESERSKKNVRRQEFNEIRDEERAQQEAEESRRLSARLAAKKRELIKKIPVDKAKSPIKKGRGFTNWVPFGPKWLMSENLLKDEDTVSLVRSHDHMKIPKHPNRVVPATVKVCLLQFLAGEAMSTDILSAEDRLWVEWLMQDAKIQFKKKPLTSLVIQRTPKQMKDRLAVLYGEIAEGPNDNPALKKEFKSLLAQATLRGNLTDKQLVNLQDFMSTFK